MKFILYFGIVCVCAVNVHSRTNEAPSLNNLLFFNVFKPQDREIKNEINVQPETPLEAANKIYAADGPLNLFSPSKERNVNKYIVDFSELLHDPISAQNEQIVDQKKEAPSKTSELSDLLSEFLQKDEGLKVVPESQKQTDEKFNIPELSRGLIFAPEKRLVKKETKAPSQNEIEVDISGMMDELISAQNKQIVDQKKEEPLETSEEIGFSDLLNIFLQKDEGLKVVPESHKKTDERFDVPELFNSILSAPRKQSVEKETKAPSQNEIDIDISESLHGLFPQNNVGVEMVSESPKKTDKRLNISELFRDLTIAPEERVVTKETKAQSQNEKEINISEMLHDLFSEKREEVKTVPGIYSKSNGEIEFSKLLNDIFSGNGENVVSKSPTKTINQKIVPKRFGNSENNIEISKLLNDLVSPQNVGAIEVIPMAYPKIEKKSYILDRLTDIISQQKEPEIISIMPLNGSTTDEKKANSPEADLSSRINNLISDIVSPLEQRLLDEFERVLVPLNDIIELGADIKNSPFTEEEIKKLGLFKIYTEIIQESYNAFKSQVHSFGANRFYETAVHSNYHLSKQQKSHIMNVLNDATERVKAESKAIYDLILKPENQQLIKSIENKKLEISASLRAISLASKSNYAGLIDDDKMQDVKTKRLSIIYNNSKLLIDIFQSKAVETLKDGIIAHVNKLVDIMNKLSIKITLSYMY